MLVTTFFGIFLQTVHSKQANRTLKQKELLKIKKRKRATPQQLGRDAKHRMTSRITDKAAVLLLSGKSLPRTVLRRDTALKTEGMEGSERIEKLLATCRR